MSGLSTNISPAPDIFHDYEDGSTRFKPNQSSFELPDMTPSVLPEPNLPYDFNSQVYLELHPDVAAAGIEAAVHYLYEGIREGRSYKPDVDNTMASS